MADLVPDEVSVRVICEVRGQGVIETAKAKMHVHEIHENTQMNLKSIFGKDLPKGKEEPFI